MKYPSSSGPQKICWSGLGVFLNRVDYAAPFCLGKRKSRGQTESYKSPGNGSGIEIGISLQSQKQLCSNNERYSCDAQDV